MKSSISIGIPTYNRSEQLRNQLKSLLKQDMSKIDEVIVVDNHSTYDVEGLINEFKTDKIRLIINPFNIKMATNMLSPFLYCNSEWLWLLSDDDETLEDSIEKIWTEIENCPTNTGMIKFQLDRQGAIQETAIVNDLYEYIDYYYSESKIRRGELVFISNNLFNINNLKEYLGFGFEFSYTYIGFLVPIFMGLNDKKISVKFSSKPIVTFIPPREGWYSFGTVGKGLSTLSHLPLNLNNQYRKKFLNITMSITHKALMIGFVKNDKIDKLDDFKIIYNNIYRYYIPLNSKVIVNVFLSIMSLKPFKIMTIRFLQLINKIK